MNFHLFIGCLTIFSSIVTGQIPYSPNIQYVSSPIVGDLTQQSNIGIPSSINNPISQQTNIQVPSSSSENYLVGNFSQPFTFEVAPPSIKVIYLGLNGYSLYIKGVGFSNKSEFNYDENTNRLTILSLDLSTVGSYSAVDASWKTFATVLSAINVSSLQISNSHVSEDNNGSSLVSCSVSIIRSTFKLPEPPSHGNILPSKSIGTENLPRLDLFISTRTSSPVLSNKKITNDTLNGQIFTRTIIIQRPLTRADHNGTIQCQVESNNNIDVYLTKIVPIDIEYGPNLETGASPTVHLESEVLKTISMECQIEANPTPSYVWYEMASNISSGLISDYDQQISNQRLSTAGQSVFGTTKQIQRVFQYPGNYAMQCQAQSRGKTLKQEFSITIRPQANVMKINANTEENHAKSYKIPVIIGISIGSILLLLVIAIIIATIIFLKRRKTNSNEKSSKNDEKLSNDKQVKSRWNGLPIDYSKYKRETLKTDSSSTSHLVESAETPSNQPPPVPARPSPMTSVNSSYRQMPSTAVSLSYRQASALPGFVSINPTRTYSPENDDEEDEVSTSINAIPLTINRSRTNTPFGSHKSLSESIQSLRSNQQSALVLPVKKRLHDPPPILPKREQKSPSPKSFEIKKDYQHHHYHNPQELRSQQQIKSDNTSSEEEQEQDYQQPNQMFQPSPVPNPKVGSSSGYNQVNFAQQVVRRMAASSPLSQKPIVGIPYDEVPPSYQQVANKSSPSHAYIYQEPTEV